MRHIYSFLFYYGRILKNLPPRHEFFTFSDSISWSEWSYSLPQNQLYAYEISQLSEHDTLVDLPTFLRHFEVQTLDGEAASFLKILYLEELIESPSYWARHEQGQNLEGLLI